LFAADEHREQGLRVCVPDTGNRAAAGSSAGPTSGYATVAPRPPDLVGQELVSRGYFAAWGVPLIAGEDFRWDDPRNYQAVTIVNVTLARKLFGQDNVVGRSIGFGACPGLPVRIVGVVADSTNTARLKPAPMLYRPLNVTQVPTPTFAVRTMAETEPVVRRIRQLIESNGIRVAGRDISLGIDYRDRMIVKESFIARLMAVFGLTTLFISCLGLYGLLTYVVERRRAEIGLRMAVGAVAGDVVRLIVAETLAPVAAGILSGVLAAYWLTQLIESLLFAVRPADPISFSAACLVLLICAGVASIVPAVRAARLDPMRALRCD
jgi:hypothetical protein